MTSQSFTEKEINVTFQLASGNFDGTSSNQATYSGLRSSAKILKAGYPSMGMLELTIWGLPLSVMNQLSTLGMKVQLVPKNLVTVSAGDSENGMTTVFIGQIFNAYADFPKAVGDPNSPFRVSAQVTAADAVIPATGLSYAAPIPVATAMATLANKMGLQFENNGVTTVLPPSYFWGTNWQQAGQVAKAANIGMVVDNLTLIIWPRNGTRSGSIPLLSPTTGLIGYPTYTAEGLHVDCLFNPNIAFQGQVQIQSSLQRASGTWGVFRLSYFLEAQMPKGKWMTSLDLWNPAYTMPVPG